MRWLSRVSQLQNESFPKEKAVSILLITDGILDIVSLWPNTWYIPHVHVCEMYLCAALEDWLLHLLIKDPLQLNVHASVPSDSLFYADCPLMKSSCLQSLKMFSVCSLFRLALFLCTKEQTRRCWMVAQLYCGSPRWLEVRVVFIQRHSADQTGVFISLCQQERPFFYNTGWKLLSFWNRYWDFLKILYIIFAK